MSIVQENESFVPCTAEPGMFDGEFLVRVEAIDPSSSTGERIDVQLFVDGAALQIQETPQRGRPVKAYLKVFPASKQHGFTTVVLPAPAVPVGDAMVVPSSAITGKSGDDSGGQ